MSESSQTSQPIAKDGDTVVGTDIHVVMVPSPGGPVPTPMPFPFTGKLQNGLSATTFVDGKAVAVEGCIAKNDPEHIPSAGSFQRSPKNEGTVERGSASVFVDGKGVVRANDKATTCADPADAPNATVIAVSTMFIGGA